MSNELDKLKPAQRKAVHAEAQRERTRSRKDLGIGGQPLPSPEEENRLLAEAKERIASDPERVKALTEAAANHNR